MLLALSFIHLPTKSKRRTKIYTNEDIMYTTSAIISKKFFIFIHKPSPQKLLNYFLPIQITIWVRF